MPRIMERVEVDYIGLRGCNFSTIVSVIKLGMTIVVVLGCCFKV